MSARVESSAHKAHPFRWIGFVTLSGGRSPHMLEIAQRLLWPSSDLYKRYTINLDAVSPRSLGTLPRWFDPIRLPSSFENSMTYCRRGATAVLVGAEPPLLLVLPLSVCHPGE